MRLARGFGDPTQLGGVPKLGGPNWADGIVKRFDVILVAS